MATFRLKTNKAAARLKRKSRDIPRAMQTELARSMPAAGELLVSTARQLVGKRTGALANAIQSEVTHGGLVLRFTVEAHRLPIPMNAVWQEFGTIKMPANPYFYASWRINKRKVRSRQRAAMKRGLKKAAA